jgi:hypothetical protein
MLRQSHLAAGNSRFPPEGGEGGTVGAAGTAFNALFKLIFNPLERVLQFLFHPMKTFRALTWSS